MKSQKCSLSDTSRWIRISGVITLACSLGCFVAMSILAIAAIVQEPPGHFQRHVLSLDFNVLGMSGLLWLILATVQVRLLYRDHAPRERYPLALPLALAVLWVIFIVPWVHTLIRAGLAHTFEFALAHTLSVLMLLYIMVHEARTLAALIPRS